MTKAGKVEDYLKSPRTFSEIRSHIEDSDTLDATRRAQSVLNSLVGQGRVEFVPGYYRLVSE